MIKGGGKEQQNTPPRGAVLECRVWPGLGPGWATLSTASIPHFSLPCRPLALRRTLPARVGPQIRNRFQGASVALSCDTRRDVGTTQTRRRHQGDGRGGAVRASAGQCHLPLRGIGGRIPIRGLAFRVRASRCGGTRQNGSESPPRPAGAQIRPRDDARVTSPCHVVTGRAARVANGIGGELLA